MSTLSSSSTRADVEAAYADDASYAEDASVPNARAFVTACRLLILKYSREHEHAAGVASDGGRRDPAEKAAAEKWLESHDAGSASARRGRG